MQIHHHTVIWDFDLRSNLLNSCGPSLKKVGHLYKYKENSTGEVQLPILGRNIQNFSLQEQAFIVFGVFIDIFYKIMYR